jgi:hypothetical protein
MINEQHMLLYLNLFIQGGFFMPKNKFQEVIFTIIMVFFMVYAMICYNISLNIGGMSNTVFLSAFHELVIMGPIAFILDFFIVSLLLCVLPVWLISEAVIRSAKSLRFLFHPLLLCAR